MRISNCCNYGGAADRSATTKPNRGRGQPRSRSGGRRRGSSTALARQAQGVRGEPLAESGAALRRRSSERRRATRRRAWASTTPTTRPARSRRERSGDGRRSRPEAAPTSKAGRLRSIPGLRGSDLVVVRHTSKLLRRIDAGVSYCLCPPRTGRRARRNLVFSSASPRGASSCRPAARVVPSPPGNGRSRHAGRTAHRRLLRPLAVSLALSAAGTLSGADEKPQRDRSSPHGPQRRGLHRLLRVRQRRLARGQPDSAVHVPLEPPVGGGRVLQGPVEGDPGETPTTPAPAEGERRPAHRRFLRRLHGRRSGGPARREARAAAPRGDRRHEDLRRTSRR